MVLIIGGAYQGKTQYAQENYKNMEIVNNFQDVVLALIEKGIDPIEHTKNMLEEYENKVIICRDISCGIVPTDELMRKWREDTGHAMAILAKESNETIRMFCGIATKLK